MGFPKSDWYLVVPDINGAESKTSPLSLVFLMLRGMMVARVHAMGWQLKNPYHCAPLPSFPFAQIPANDHWEPLAKKGVKVAFLHISGGL